MGFGEKLKAELQRKGMSLNRLCQLAGLSQGSMTRVANGDGEPSWTTVTKICAVLEIPCTAFQPDKVELPDPAPERPRGRPKGTAEQPTQDADGPKEDPPPAGDRPTKKPAGKGAGRKDKFKE